MQLSQEDLLILKSLPLTEVMQNNGHRVVFRTQRDAYYHCPLPSHDDKDASFSVEMAPSSDDGVCAFSCKGCKGISGYGAISLQSQLLGGDAQPSGAKFWEVVTRLCHDFRLNIEGVKPNEAKWQSTEPVDELCWQETAWTDQHLRALGCTVEQRFVHRDDDIDDATDDNIYGWGWVSASDGDQAEACSIIQEQKPFDPTDISRRFGIYPVSEYTTPKRKAEDGSERSYRHVVTDSYPVFVIKSVNQNGKWRVKKYEPYARNAAGRSYKWTWWYEGGGNQGKAYAHTMYGDTDVIDSLYNKDVVPQDTSVYKNHPVVEKRWREADGTERVRRKFRDVVICSGPRDAMQVYYHSGAHVVYPHSETAEILDVTLKRLLSISENLYILFDMDATGRKQAERINREYLQMRNIHLPEDLATLTARRNGKPCKDVSDFFEQYLQVARTKSDQKYKSINEIFFNLMANAAPLKFWDKRQKRVQGGETQYVYGLKPTMIKEFIKACGFCIYRGENDLEEPRYARVKDNTLHLISDNQMITRVKDCLLEWLANHAMYNEIGLRDEIAKSSQILSKQLMDQLPTISYNPRFWSATTDYLFFSNGALKVTAKEATLIPYGELDFLVIDNCILPYPYVPSERTFEIVQNPMMETYEQQHNERLATLEGRAIEDENIRWVKEQKLWSHKLKLLRPMNEMPVAFQFLYNTGRHFWRKEAQAKREGQRDWRTWLSKEQHQYQDMQFINKAAGLGYMMSRQRDSKTDQFVCAVDYSVGDETSNKGGTGKSLIGKMLKAVRYECKIDGKTWKSTAEMAARNLAKYDYLRDGYININDLRRSAEVEGLFNLSNDDFNKKLLNKDETTIKSELAAKLFVSTNAMFDLNDPSTFRRVWLMLVGDYYHPAKESKGLEECKPSQKFGYDIGRDTMPEKEFYAMIEMLVECLQFYLSDRTYIQPPMGEAGKMRILKNNPIYKNDKQFPDWARKLFEGDMFYGVPLPKTDLCVSYFQACGREVTQQGIIAYAKSAEFGRMLRTYCDTFGITYNPDGCYRRPSEVGRMPRCSAWVYEFDANGRLTGRRIKDAKTSCYYFYRRGEEPITNEGVLFDQVGDPGCEGYVSEE